MAEEFLQKLRQFDANDDGVISRAELARLVKDLGSDAFDGTAVEGLCDQLDTNNDGQVDYLKFVNLLFEGSPDNNLVNYLPGKIEEKHGINTLIGELTRRWECLEQEVEAARTEYEEHTSGGQGAFCNIEWCPSIVVPKAYWNRGAAIEKTEFRAVSLSQLNYLASLVHKVFQEEKYHDKFSGQVVTWDNVNMYLINEHIVMPLTSRFECSFVDLVATGQQRPIWFISHWWGTPFKDTIALLNWHARCRKLTTAVTYWICTLANNQHHLGELAGSLTDTPFVKAICDPRCVGTCAVFDSNATTFTRVWCILEGQFSTMEVQRTKPGFRYDLTGMLVQGFKGACLRMDMGDGEADEHCEGNTVFPGIISYVAAGLRVEMASASVEQDRRQILHHIVDTPIERRNEEPPQEHPKYDELNHHMRRGFAGQGLIRAIKIADTAMMRSILKEFPEAVHFVSKRAGSIWDVAHRHGVDPEVVAIVEEAMGDAGSS